MCQRQRSGLGLGLALDPAQLEFFDPTVGTVDAKKQH